MYFELPSWLVEPLPSPLLMWATLTILTMYVCAVGLERKVDDGERRQLPSPQLETLLLTLGSSCESGTLCDCAALLLDFD